MGQFAYGFLLTVLHSLWQSAMLLLVYFLINFFFKKQLPNSRRNFLYLLLFAQLGISCITFWIYYPGFKNLYEFGFATDYTSMFTTLPFFHKIAPWLFYSYMIIVAYKTIRLVYHWHNFKTTCRQSFIKPSVDLKLFTQLKSCEFGIRRKINLWYCSAISTPVTFGFFKPVILLPVALINQLTLEEAETLILHELAHIKSNDYLLNFILIVSETLFFFNPFIKIIAGRINLEREKNCDIQVLQFKYSSLTYAETLLKAARFKPKRGVFLIAAVSKNKQLLSRILFFTSENNLNFSRKNYSALNYFFIIAVFCFNFFTINEINRQPFKFDSAYASAFVPGYNSVQANTLFTEKALTAAVIHADKSIKSFEECRPPFKNEFIKLMPFENKLENLVTQELEVLQSGEENYAISAAATEADDIKEVIIKEENPSSGNSITKAYKMIFVNGEWVTNQLWIYSESKLKKDSFQLMKDSIIKPFHIIQ